MSFGWASNILARCCLLALFFSAGDIRAQDTAENTAENKETQLISIDFVDADIHDVIRVLAEAKYFNFVVGQQVNGMVTIKLKDVSLETALDAVVNSNGFRYRIKDNFLKVDTAQKFAEEDQLKLDALSQEQLLTIVFELKYINGNDVLELLKTQLTPRGKIVPVSSTIPGGYTPATMSATGTSLAQGGRSANKPAEAVARLIVIDTVQGITLVKKLLDELDVMPVQILIESKMVESLVDTRSDIGVRWDFLGRDDNGNGGMALGLKDLSKEYGVDYTRTTNDTRGLVATDTGTRTFLDDMKRDLVNENESVSGVSTPTITNTLTHNLEDKFENTNELVHTLDAGIDLADKVTRLTTATLTASNFGLILHALKTKGGVEVISNPSILTMNNREASILVGERYPILRASTSGEGSNQTIQSLDHYEPIGVQLQVLPRVMDSDYVNMLIRPSVTALGPLAGSAELQINRITTREASTELIVKSGDTIVIGGLISDETHNNGSEIPLLGRIPVIGKLFSYKQKKGLKVNLVVFVTPTIVNGSPKMDREPSNP